MSEIDLLPRADLPVIWQSFKDKTEAVRILAETLVVTDVTQKEAMALARKTRLTLREIRIAVEHKRVELGEGHLKEIQKVNGAAKAIREFIEPLEARLLDQETFAERAEADRIAALSKSRSAEVSSFIGHHYTTLAELGKMPQEVYDGHIARLRAEKAELEEANRLRVEAEKQLAEVRAEAQKRAIELQLELKAESDRLKAEAKAEAERVAEVTRAAFELAQKVALDVKQKRDAEVKAELDRQCEEQKRIDAEKVARDADLAEQKRIRDEQFAKLEAELAQERAAKQAEADAARKLALAPDVEKLWDFACRINGVKCPPVASDEAKSVVQRVSNKFVEIRYILDTFCRP